MLAAKREKSDLQAMTRFTQHSEKSPSSSPASRLLRHSVGVALCAIAGGALFGCMTNNQAEVDQLRAQLKAAQDELAALKSQPTAAPSSTPPAAAVAQQPATGADAPAPEAQPVAPAAPPFEDAKKTFEAEEKDAEWAVKRQKGLLDAARAHIKDYGATLNSVVCKKTMCAVVIDVPEKPKQPYEAMPNPWAETSVAIGKEPIYNKQTRWTYLISRHAKDHPNQGEQRVDPLALAQPEKAAAKPKQLAAAPKPAAAPAAPKAASNAGPANAKSQPKAVEAAPAPKAKPAPAAKAVSAPAAGAPVSPPAPAGSK